MRQTARIALAACAGAAATILVVLVYLPEWPPFQCRQMDESLATALFDEWNNALQVKPPNPDKVAQTYTLNAVLLPTFKIGPFVGRDKIRGYFADTFLKENPVGRIDTRAIIPAGCNMGVVAGLYTFTVTERNVRVDKPARYTFVYVYEAGLRRWLIAHHHSSAQPK